MDECLEFEMSGDPVADAVRYSHMEERRADRYPRCAECDGFITDDWCYLINGDLLCRQCVDWMFLKSTEDYIMTM